MIVLFIDLLGIQMRRKRVDSTQVMCDQGNHETIALITFKKII